MVTAPSESNWWRFKCYKELDDEKYTSDLLEWLDIYDEKQKCVETK